MVALLDTREAPVAVLDARLLLADLSQRRVTIAISVLFGLLAALGVALFMQPRFVAQTKILVNPIALQILPNNLSTTGASSDATVAALESQVQIVTSTEVLDKVVAGLGLDHDPEFGGSVASLTDEGSPPPLRTGGSSWATLRALRKVIEVRRPDRTAVIEVSVWTRSPEKSERIADAIARAYLDVMAENQAATASRTAEELGSRLASLQKDLQSANDGVEALRVANNLETSDGKLLTDQELADVSKRLSEQRIRTAELVARMDVLRKGSAGGGSAGGASIDTLAEALQSPTITNLRARYADAKKAEVDSTTSLGPRHPTVIAAHAQVVQTRALIDGELARVQRGLATEYRRSRDVESQLGLKLEAARQASAAQHAAVLKLRDLEGEAAARRAVYETVQRRAKEVREEGMFDSTNAHVISPAALSPPEYLVPRMAVVAGGALVGLLVGLVLAALRNAMPRAGGRTDAARGFTR